MWLSSTWNSMHKQCMYNMNKKICPKYRTICWMLKKFVWKKIEREKKKWKPESVNICRENDVEKRMQWIRWKRKTWYLYLSRLCKHCGLFALFVYTFTFVSEKFSLPHAYLSLHRSIWHCGLPWWWSWCLKNESSKQILWLPVFGNDMIQHCWTNQNRFFIVQETTQNGAQNQIYSIWQ